MKFPAAALQNFTTKLANDGIKGDPGHAAALPFGSGYWWHAAESSLIVATPK